MEKGIIKAMATKFSEMFAISMLKKRRKFCRRGLTHLDATPTYRPNTYETPCNSSFYSYFIKSLILHDLELLFFF